MYKILLKLKRFIKRYLKVKSETRQTPVVGARHKVNKLIMLFLTAGLIALLYPAETLFYPLDFPRKGEIARDDILSPFQIVVYKSEGEMQEERNDAARAIPIIIEYQNEPVDSIFSKFYQFINYADSTASRVRAVRKDSAEGYVEKADSIISAAVQTILGKFPYINGEAVARLIDENDVGTIGSIIEDILQNNIYFYGVLPDVEILPNENSRSIIVRIGKRDVFMVRDKLLDRSSAFVSFRNALKNKAMTERFDVDLVYEIGRHFIIPNLEINFKEMESRRQAVVASIDPIKETVSEGDLIARAGSRITERQQEILREIYQQKEAEVGERAQYRQYVSVLARFVLILAMFSFLYLYLYYFRRPLYRSNPKILALLLIFGLELVLVYFVDVKLQLSIYLFPVAIFSMLITILFDSEIGIVNTFILAILLGILHRFNFNLALVTIVAGTVACYSTRRVRHRAEFFRSILYLSITYLILIYLIESFKITPSEEEILNLIGLGIINAVISPLLTIGILPVFESLFGFTTDITLLELSDLNHPLLKRLALEAPGTYHHSIIVGNLAENAAKAINANSLLARVGAYYHDIGKIEIPEYFVENQLGIKSKHQDLTPTMSAIILSSHVKKGRIMGEEADLPDEVLNFIEEHHGTMTMEYFYNKAKEMGIENPETDEFTYPGPKPQIRETAIVMLADSVEAAGRTLTDPKPSRIRNLVQNIINARFQSGELEECPLTLRDLAQIRESFIQILLGVFHHRVEYPKKEAVE